MMKRRYHLAVFGLFLLVAVGITWPLVTQLDTRIAGFGYSDAYEMTHHIWWFQYALHTGQPLFEQPLMGYPNGIEGVTLWSNPLQFFPAWLFALVVPVAVAYNVTLLLTMALNGWAMFVLARHLTGQAGPALLAGVVFLAFPTMQGHLGASHGGLMVQWPVPLYVLALLRLRATPSARGLLATALLFILTAFGHTLQILYVTLPVTALFALTLIIKREWAAFWRVAAACLIGALALGAFLIPVAQATFGTAAYTDAGGAVRYSADLLAAVTPSFLHPLFGRLGYPHRVLGINIDEGYAYVGIVAAVLAVLALVRVRAARWWGLLALGVYVLSLGPLLKLYDQPVRLTIGGNETFLPLPSALFDALPVLNLARTPGRFNFALALALAALAAYGLSVVWPRLGRRARWGFTALLAALVLFEYQAFWPLPTVSAAVPAEITALREADDVRAVFDVPWDNLVAAKQALFLQTAHQQALIAGHVTRSTPVAPAKLMLLQATLDPALLQNAGADLVIIHREYDPDNTLYDRAEDRLGEALYRDDDYAVFRVPAAEPPTQPALLLTDALTITDKAHSYLWTPEPGWMMFNAALSADDRTAVLRLDGATLGRWQVNGQQSVRVPLPLSAGYHTLTLSVEPACPQVFSPALRCQTLEIHRLTLGELVEGESAAVGYGGGVVLVAAQVAPASGDHLPVWLWWQFTARRSENDIRFVHMVNETGTLVAQVDGTLGVRAPGDALAEVVELALPPDLPDGTYSVYAGWYTYPDAVRFPVLADVPGAQNGYALVGEYRVGD